MTAPALRPAAAARAFWWICALAAPPIACAVAAAGYPMATSDPLRDLTAIALWSVAEEIVFRGALQPALARALEGRLWPRRRDALLLTPANFLTSLVFAAFHLWRHPLAVAIGVFPVSLVYGKARELSGRWWPAALLHLHFNALLYAASWLLAGGR
jgi:membrane protease YdiL (CAAX protease family)